MKTLYININNKQIQSNEELEVLNYDLDSDFFFYLGEKIAKGCKVENENALITDFNTSDNEEDYKRIISQWNELKTIIFSKEYEGEFDFTLPNGYIDWLRIHPQYFSIHDANFSNDESVIPIDLEELYKESIEELQRKILRKLKKNNLHLEIDEIVFDDDAVTRNSAIVRTIKEKYNGIGFKAYKKWKENQQYFNDEIVRQEKISNVPTEKNKTSLHNKKSNVQRNNIKTFITFLFEKRYLFIDKNDELILRFPADTNFGGSSYAELVDNYLLSIYLWKIFQYEYDIYLSTKQLPTTSTPPIVLELLEDRIIRIIDEKNILALNLSAIGSFADDFMTDFRSCHINLSKYLRHCFHFDYLNNNLEKTFVSWGIINEYYGYITKTKLLCSKIYKKIANVSDNDEIIAVNDGHKNYILNKSKGKILPIEFENTPRFYEDLAKILKNGKWGYIDTTGNMVISTQFDEASNFSNGTARVKLNGGYYLINRRGELFEGYVPFDKR